MFICDKCGVKTPHTQEDYNELHPEHRGQGGKVFLSPGETHAADCEVIIGTEEVRARIREEDARREEEKNKAALEAKEQAWKAYVAQLFPPFAPYVSQPGALCHGCGCVVADQLKHVEFHERLDAIERAAHSTKRRELYG